MLAGGGGVRVVAHNEDAVPSGVEPGIVASRVRDEQSEGRRSASDCDEAAARYELHARVGAKEDDEECEHCGRSEAKAALAAGIASFDVWFRVVLWW